MKTSNIKVEEGKTFSPYTCFYENSGLVTYSQVRNKFKRKKDIQLGTFNISSYIECFEKGNYIVIKGDVWTLVPEGTYSPISDVHIYWCSRKSNEKFKIINRICTTGNNGKFLFSIPKSKEHVIVLYHKEYGGNIYSYTFEVE